MFTRLVFAILAVFPLSSEIAAEDEGATDADAITAAKSLLSAMRCENADLEMWGSAEALFEFVDVRYVARRHAMTELDRMNRYQWRGEVVRTCRMTRKYEPTQLGWGDWEYCSKSRFEIRVEKQDDVWFVTDGVHRMEFSGNKFESESSCADLPIEARSEK